MHIKWGQILILIGIVAIAASLIVIALTIGSAILLHFLL